MAKNDVWNKFKRDMKTDLILLLTPFLILLDSLTDVLWFRGDKAGSKIIENVYKTGLIIVFLSVFGIDRDFIIGSIILYWSFHFLLFDVLFNLLAHLDINYVGTTSGVYDKVMKKLGKVWPWVMRVTIFAIAIFIYYNSLKK